ncbi:MAG: RIP metalloprotease RseP [Rhodospirillales bacterium]|nr:RIP metalloprotease RseP [Rhodospirillales bacterium]
MPDLLRSVAAFAVVLGVLIFFHELGHYLAARWRGVKVEAFSIGFGPILASRTDRAGTVWKLCALPLGGYVKMHGQERPQDVSAEERARWVPGRTFHEKSVASRAIIVGAGPFANFLLAIVVFAVLFGVIGRPVTLPVVDRVLPHSAAATAGILKGDRIVAVNGARIADFQALQAVIETHPATRLTVTVARAGKTLAIAVTTGARVLDGRRMGLLGVAGSQMAYRPMSPPDAVLAGLRETWKITTETASGLAQIITGKRGTKDLGGPVRIAQMSGQVAELGLPSLLSFIAVLSVNIGLINLFPIPILDGGHLLFYLFEAIRGRPLPPRAQEYGFRAGLALLAGLFVFATFNDLSHLGLFHWLGG